MLRNLLAATAALALTGLAATAQAQEGMPEVIRFGIIPTESTMNLKTVWDPFLQDMEEELGTKVEGFFASDYAGIIEAMRFDKVDVAWFGNKSAMEAVDRAGGQIFAQTTSDEGHPGYWSILIARKDSPINSLEDVLACDRSIDFGIGDPNSTSGFLVPMTFIFAANEVTPKDCFATVRNASHGVNLMAVAQGQVQVATNNTENWARFAETNPEAIKEIKEIWRSPLIPSDPILWREKLAPQVKSELYHFIMTYGRNGTPEEVEAEREILTELGWSTFQPSSNRQLLPIREMELTKERMMVQADEALSKEQKAERLAEINARLAGVRDSVKSASSM